MVRIIRMYIGLGFTVTVDGDSVIFNADRKGNWYLDGVLVASDSDSYLADKAFFPAFVAFEAKVGLLYKKHTKWVEF